MKVLSTDDESAAQRGVHEIVLRTDTSVENPYLDIDIEVQFERPNGSTVTVDGFYDGDGTYRVRAYCDMLGEWRWESNAADPNLVASGSFTVCPSSLPGKLRQHRDDPRQLRYDDGKWFLHVGDTGCRPSSSSALIQTFLLPAQVGIARLIHHSSDVRNSPVQPESDGNTREYHPRRESTRLFPRSGEEARE